MFTCFNASHWRKAAAPSPVSPSLRVTAASASHMLNAP